MNLEEGTFRKPHGVILISPFVFILAGIAAILITIINVSIQSIKAALANPVKSLRTE